VGNGSNELIQTLIYAVCDSKDQILTVRPGFSIYKRVSSIMNIKVKEVPLKHDFRYDGDDILEKSKDVKMIILCSPNNSTGTVLKTKDIERIAQNFQGMVAVDEAYYEFHKKTAQKLIKKFNNLVILRTFSKALGLASIRLGYLLGGDEMVKILSKAKLPFSLGIFQQAAGEVILEKKEFIKQRVSRIIKERDWLFGELKKIKGIHPIPSHANFILFESQKFSGKDLYRILFESGVLVRTFDDPDLKNMVRVTVGTHEENELFLEKLGKTNQREWQ
jgi:histidinol-phosphate aminotransferase